MNRAVFAALILLGLALMTYWLRPTAETPPSGAPDPITRPDQLPAANPGPLPAADPDPLPRQAAADDTVVVWDGDGIITRIVPGQGFERESAWAELSVEQLKQLSGASYGANIELQLRLKDVDLQQARHYGLRGIILGFDQAPDIFGGTVEHLQLFHASDHTDADEIRLGHLWARLGDRLGADYTYTERFEAQMVELGIEPLPLQPFIDEVNALSLALRGTELVY